MLNTFTPGLYVQYFRDLRDADGPLAAGKMAEVMTRYATSPGTEFL